MERGTMLRLSISVLIALLASACASSPPQVPAPVESPQSEPDTITRSYPLEQRPEFVGRELEGAAPSEESTEDVMLGVRRDGTPEHLSDYSGKVVVANYWASWCPPCWTELQQLEQIREEYAGRDVAIIAVNFGESASAIDAFLRRQQTPLRLTILSDHSTRASLEQGVESVPTTLVFDAEGRVVRRYVGLFGFSASRIRGDIDRLLQRRG